MSIRHCSKKTIAILLCVAILALSLPITALAALATPKLNGAVASGNGIKVTWQAVTGATGYRVYRKGDGKNWEGLGDTTATSYQDNKAKAGVTYTYTVRCLKNGSVASDFDGIGVSAAWNNSTAGYLATPKLVSAKAEGKAIRFTWKKVSGATGYRVYRKYGSKSWEAVANVGNTDSYLDNNTSSGTKYTYTVRCLKGGSVKSDFDTTGVTGSWTASSKLATPKLTSAVGEGSGIRVTWKSVTGAYAYRLYRKSGGGSWEGVTDVKATTYLDNATKEGTTYTYTVRCLNSKGQLVSDFDTTGVSGVWHSGGGNLTTPQLVSATVKDGKIIVKWKSVPGASGYRVYRKTPSVNWQAVKVVTGTSYTEASPSSGVKYTYTVRAVNAAGKNASDYDANGVSATSYATPTLISAASVSNGIKVTWKAVKGAPLYVIWRKTGTGSYSIIGYTSGTSYTDSKIVAGTTYTYTVAVVSSDKKTVLSNHNTGVSAKYVGYAEISSLSNAVSGIVVKWKEVVGAAKYRLYRKFGSGDWVAIAVVTGTQYTDTTVSNNITYTYTVRALDSSNKIVGTYDKTGKTMTYYAAPTMIDCVRVQAALVTTWEAVEGISNYAVFRKIGTGSWTLVAKTTATTYTDTEIPSGTKCWYTVRCASADGKNYLSAYDPVGVGETAFTEYPILISATRETDHIHVEWHSVDKATRYNVYRKTGARTSWGDPYAIAVAGVEFDDFGVVNGTTYYYTVSVCDAAGNDQSEHDETGVNALYYGAPVMTEAINDLTGIKVTWQAADGVGSYQVYRKTGNSDWTAIDTVNGTSYTDTNVVTNGSYKYTVSCMVDGVEVSSYDPVGVGSTYYPAPTVSSVTNQNGSIKITWKSVDGIGTYRLYRKTNNGNWVNQGDFNATSYTDTAGLTSGAKYTYTVRCVQGGEAVSSFTAGKSTTYLTIPTVTVSSTETGKVKVSWNGVTGAVRYDVHRREATATSWSYIGASTTLDYTDSTAKSGYTYYYMVLSVSSDGSRCANGNGASVVVK